MGGRGLEVAPEARLGTALQPRCWGAGAEPHRPPRPAEQGGGPTCHNFPVEHRWHGYEDLSFHNSEGTPQYHCSWGEDSAGRFSPRARDGEVWIQGLRLRSAEGL